MSNLDIAEKIIEGFYVDKSAFIVVSSRNKLSIKGSPSNKVFSKEALSKIDLNINFIDSENSVVFLGKNLKGLRYSRGCKKFIPITRRNGCTLFI